MAIIRRAASSLAFVFSLLLTSVTASAVDLDSAHLAVPGDFNADGRLDVLLQPLTRADKGALVLQDGTGNLSVVAQGWDPSYLGLDWSAGASTLSTADLNGDGQDDVIVQPRKLGQTAAVLIADPSVQFLAVNQLLPKGYLGLDWSSAANSLVAGDFDGDHHKELFLQSMKRAGTGALVHADAQGHLIAIYQSFPDRYLGRHWSAADETFYVGDFNGDGRQDLLVQSQGRAGESAYALLLADGNGRFTRLNETWNLKDLGADWDPATHAIVIEDANGDGIMDITLRSKTGGTNYLFEGSPQNNFGKPAVQWTGNKSAADALADKDKKDGKRNGTGTKTGISIGIGSGGPTARTITGGTDPEQTATTTRSGQGVSGSGSIMTVNAVGALKGSGGVSGGTATYSIPISVPPGIAGMQPSVSLNYSSRGGNGEMGMGWSLGAGSQIHRCPATRAMDNYPSGVSYGNDDRLCLDGQHLVLVSGTYGYVNAVYRTERDSFARITQSGGGFGSTSSYFTVEQADGHTSIYGNTTDSVFVAGGQSAPLAWGLNRVKDRFSNTINYHYTAYGTGEYLLTSIDYTGTGSTAGNREVDFNYQTRNDGGNQYLAGGLTQQTKLLSSIVTKVNGTQVMTYNTEYTSSSATGRSLLAGVQQCGGSGSSKLCLAETTFSWHAPSTGFDSPAALDADSFCDGGDQYGLSTHVDFTFASPGDLNGDGRKDLIMYRQACGAEVLFAQPGGGYGDAISLGGMFSQYMPPGRTAADLDGDGVAEVVGQYPNPDTGDTAHPYLWGYSKYVPGTTPSFAAPTQLPLPEDDYLVGVEDIDGDGRADILAVEVDPDHSGYHRFVAYLNTTPPCTSCSGRTISFSSTAKFIYRDQDVTDSSGTRWLSINELGDMNGDGLPDFGVGVSDSPGDDSGLWIYPQVDSSGTLSFTVSTESVPGTGYTLDINGDGLPDKVYKCDANSHWCYQLNTGEIGSIYGSEVDTGITDSIDGSDYQQAGMLVADLDGDGTQELVFPDVLKSDYCMLERITGGDMVNHCFNGGGSGPDISPTWDYSVYQYRRIKFAWGQDSGGVWKYIPQGAATSIIAQSHTAIAVDVDGDGLTDIVSSFNKVNLTDSFQDVSSFTRPHGPHYVSNASGSSTSLNAAPDLMLTATDGYGVQSKWNYYPLSSGVSYNGTGLYQAPTLDDTDRYKDSGYFYFDSSMYVVGNYSLSDGTDAGGSSGSFRVHKFHYGPAIYNSQGRGFQGFRTVVDDDMGTGARTVQYYYQHFPLSGMLRKSWVTVQSTTEMNLISPAVDSSAIDYTVNTWGCIQQDASGTALTVDGVTCTKLLDAPTFVPALQQSVDTKYDVATGDELSSTTTQYCAVTSGACTGYGYDLYGNSLGFVSVTDDAQGTYTSSTSMSYAAPDVANWWLNKLTGKTTTVDSDYTRSGGADQGTVTRLTEYDYLGDGTRGLNHTYVRQDNTAANTVTTHYDYARGNVTSVTVTGGSGATAIASRTTTTDYPTTGANAYYFADSTTNAAGQTTNLHADSRFGSLDTVTDPNGVETDTVYDVFGRKTSVQVVDPISVPAQIIQYLPHTSGDGFCDGTSAPSEYYVLVNQAGHPGSYTCYDIMGRGVRSVTESFSSAGDDVSQSTYYDGLGRVTQTSEPHFDGATVYWNTNSYDSTILGRLSSHTDAKGVTTSYKYNHSGDAMDLALVGGYRQLVTHISTAASDMTTREDQEVKDSAGRMLSVTNAITQTGEATTLYEYDSDGNPLTITAADGSQITAQYNILGQKTQVSDPDQGTTTYTYDVLGELLTQTDAKSQTLTMGYDVLGRMVSKSSSVSGEPSVSWYYDGTNTNCGDGSSASAAPYIGKLRCVVQLTAATDPGLYQQNYMYDSNGRPNHVRDIIGSVSSNINYDTDTTYDADGRVDTITYPDSISDAAPVANAHGTQYVLPSATVTLSGSATDADSGPNPVKYQWAQTGGTSVSLSSATAASPTFTAGSTLGTTYTFLLTADDGLFAGTDVATVKIPSGPGIPSSLADDGDTDNHDGSYVVSWNPVSVTGTTMKYHLEEANSDTNSAPSSGSYSEIACNGVSGGTTATSCTVSHAGNTHYYYWYRVRAEDFLSSTSIAVGSYTSTDSIHLVVKPGAPASISPTSGVGAVNTNYSITWGAYSGSVTSSKVFYELYESTSSTFSSQTLIYSGAAGSGRTYTLQHSSAGSFYYRVRSCNQDGSTKVCSAYADDGFVHVFAGGGGGGGLVMPHDMNDPTDSGSTGLDRYASARVEGTAIYTGDLVMPVGSPRAPISGARPEFDKPVYEAYVDAKVVKATGGTGTARLSVQYVYTTNGYLWQLVDAVNPNRVFWQVDKTVGEGTDSQGNAYEYGMDARGNVTDSQYGASIKTHFGYDPHTGYLETIHSAAGSTVYQDLSYTWMKVGNLTNRSSNVGGTTLSETFTYDLHNRVMSSTVSNASGPQTPVTYYYGPTGNVTCKSDLVGHDCSTDHTGYVYGQGGAFPHALTSVVNGTTTVSSYAYDASGNMACRDSASTGCTGTSPTANIAWNSDGLPLSITADANDVSTFKYAPDKHRYNQVATTGGTPVNTTYVGDFQLDNTNNNASIKYNHYLSAYGRPVMLDSLSNDGGTVSEDKEYLLTDHLGSVVASVADSTGTAAGESYDTFGKCRSASDWHSSGTCGGKKGYTSQEHLTNVGLIHMNGRVYDPTVGRFLSVDPLFQAPTNTQSVNPYSYVMNNPLSLTDPSGYASAAETTIAEKSGGPGIGGMVAAASVTIDGGLGGGIGGSGGRDSEGNLIPTSIDNMKPGDVAVFANGTIIQKNDDGTFTQYGGNGATEGTIDASQSGKAGGGDVSGSAGQGTPAGLTVCWTVGNNRHSASLGTMPVDGAMGWTQGASSVNVYTSAALDVLLPVTGGTDRERAEVKADIMAIEHTGRGSEIFNEALSHGIPVETKIDDGPYYKAQSGVPGGPAVVENGFPREAHTTKDNHLPVTMIRQVAHELFGHGIDGVRDAGPGDMDNVRRNENPIMMELAPEEGERTKYP